jgi:glycosyl transferase family 25
MPATHEDTPKAAVNSPDFWPVFVISLADATERRANITAQLAALSIPFEFIEAIDGRKRLPAEYEHLIDREGTKTNFVRAMSDGEYACALSHMSVYHRVITEGLPGAIVLEDDAIISPEFAKFRTERCYERGALIQLDHIGGLIWRKYGYLDLGAGFKAGVASQITHPITGYTVSHTAAAFLREHGLPITRPADWPCDVTLLPKLLAVPRLVRQPPTQKSTSFLENGRQDVNRLNPIRRVARFFQKSYWKRKARRPWTKRVS